ncbi:hypothetical protein D3C77_578990 [compost metagenome]
MVDRAVVAAVGPFITGGGGQFELLGDLGHGVTLVCQVQRLIVNVLEHVALAGEKVDDACLAPGWPVVLSQDYFDLVTVGVDSQVQGLPPVGSITYLGAAQSVEVVQGMSGIFGGVEQLELREPDQHF